MKDKATEWLMGLNPFDKVKGHTKIELTDVKTGKKQVIEKDNAFQAGVLASYMRSMGAYNNNPYANSTWAGQPIWRNLCGGILCFRDAIDLTNGEVEYMPAGNEMVANGAYMVNNAGTPIELGSYNEVESSTSGNDSVTFVYDWLTSQGNGTISCVCLTTEIGGYIGYGNKSGAQASGKSFTQNQSSNRLSGACYGNARYVFGNLDTANKTITVTRYPTEVAKGSIFDNIAEDSFTITYTGNNPSRGMSDGDAIPLGNGKFIVRFSGGGSHETWNNGGSETLIMVVDVVNETAQTYTVTNNTGIMLCLGRFGLAAVDDTHIFVQGFSHPYPCYAINYKNGQSTTALFQASVGDIDQHPTVKGGIIMPDRTYLYYKMWDKVADTIYPVNANIYLWGKYNPDTDTLAVTSFDNWNYGGTCMYKNPLILSTINNLETPVTKTAAQTMKITYTLSKASE